MTAAVIATSVTAVIMFLLALLVIMGSILQKGELESEIKELKEIIMVQEAKLEIGKAETELLNSPNCMFVGFCGDCEHWNSWNKECMRTYTFEEAGNYCSKWTPKEKSLENNES